jgi:hypothetical protein
MLVYAGCHIVSKLRGLSFECSPVWELCVCLNYWADEIKENKLDVHVACMWERRSVYRVFVGNPREKVH